MRLERKHAVLFLGIAAWNVFSYVTFAKNLSAGHGDRALFTDLGARPR